MAIVDIYGNQPKLGVGVEIGSTIELDSVKLDGTCTPHAWSRYDRRAIFRMSPHRYDEIGDAYDGTLRVLFFESNRLLH